ncbi:unnamed protein product [Albugo candida]|uniref:Uncharacterized protein n=1 Tax=Albugo candida TaxID=65357 RepID=A0A024GFW2_9STRA|nr:unnamed protein product [Albugo candida]|eukprot:CCI45653.1 unnamed protein product [Albugo candida]
MTTCIHTQSPKKTSPPFVPNPIVKSTDTENENAWKKELIAVLQLSGGTVRYKSPNTSNILRYLRNVVDARMNTTSFHRQSMVQFPAIWHFLTSNAFGIWYKLAFKSFHGRFVHVLPASFRAQKYRIISVDNTRSLLSKLIIRAFANKFKGNSFRFFGFFESVSSSSILLWRRL